MEESDSLTLDYTTKLPVKNTIWYLYKKRNVDQWSRIESVKGSTEFYSVYNTKAVPMSQGKMAS